MLAIHKIKLYFQEIRYKITTISFFQQFMQKHVSKRLGCVTAHGGEEAIKHHSFFRDVKWKDLEDRKIKPPFRPKIVSSIVHFRSLRRILFLFIYNSIRIVANHVHI